MQLSFHGDPSQYEQPGTKCKNEKTICAACLISLYQKPSKKRQLRCNLIIANSEQRVPKGYPLFFFKFRFISPPFPFLSSWLSWSMQLSAPTKAQRSLSLIILERFKAGLQCFCFSNGSLAEVVYCS